jgi:hypothetical protein
MDYKLSHRYSLSNNWYEQLSHSAEILYGTESQTPLKFDPSAKRTIVEIGIFEGASTCWWSDNLLDHPESRLYSIDPFTGSEEHHASDEMRRLLPSIEATARRNIAVSKNASKVSIIKGCSWDVFPVLSKFLEQQIDILYIDGAHDAVSICRDSSLFYPLVKDGGAVIWDDYGNAECQRAIHGVVAIFCPLREYYVLHGQFWGLK